MGQYTKQQLQSSFNETSIPAVNWPKASRWDFLLFAAYVVEAIFVLPLVLIPAVLLTIAYVISDLVQPLVRSQTSAILRPANGWTLWRFRSYPVVSLALWLFAGLLKVIKDSNLLF